MSFFFNETSTTDTYTLPLHDALPICRRARARSRQGGGQPQTIEEKVAAREAERRRKAEQRRRRRVKERAKRAEEIGEHTSELQSRQYLVCRLLLEKKKNYIMSNVCVC